MPLGLPEVCLSWISYAFFFTEALIWEVLKISEAKRSCCSCPNLFFPVLSLWFKLKIVFLSVHALIFVTILHICLIKHHQH